MTPNDGLPTFLAYLWAWYRLLLFDDSMIDEDWTATIDRDKLIDLILYSVMESASKILLRVPAFILTWFVFPVIGSAGAFYFLFGQKAYDLVINILNMFKNIFFGIIDFYKYLFNNFLEAIGLVWTIGIVHTITTFIEAVGDVWNANMELWNVDRVLEMIKLSFLGVLNSIWFFIKLPFVLTWYALVYSWKAFVWTVVKAWNLTVWLWYNGWNALIWSFKTFW